MDAKNRILLSASKLFATHGYKATSIRVIAKHAKVNISMISYYFQNKEKLYQTILSLHMDDLKHAIEEISEENEEIFLKKFIKIHIDTIKKRGKYIALITMREFIETSTNLNVFLDNYIIPITNKLEQTIQKGIEKNKFKHLNVSILAKILVGINITLGVKIDNICENEMARIAYEIFLNGIKSKNIGGNCDE